MSDTDPFAREARFARYLAAGAALEVARDQMLRRLMDDGWPLENIDQLRRKINDAAASELATMLLAGAL